MSDDRRSRKDLLTDAEIARAELYETLGLLTERLNFAKRVDVAMDNAAERVREEKLRNPLKFAAGVAAVAAGAGLATWAIARAVLRRVR